MPENGSTMQQAYDDLQRRSLSKIPGDLARLIYLASTREYNTGRYHHDGLAARYREDAAEQALREAHRHVFQKVAACSLEELVEELRGYVGASSPSPGEAVRPLPRLVP